LMIEWIPLAIVHHSNIGDSIGLNMDKLHILQEVSYIERTCNVGDSPNAELV
jgi:hypothetical protein